MSTAPDKTEYLKTLLLIGSLAAEDAAGAQKQMEALLAADTDSPLALVQLLIGGMASDWTLTAFLLHEQLEQGEKVSAEKYRRICTALGRTCGEPLPHMLRWRHGGVTVSPVCRDFLLMREPELPSGAKLCFCEEKKVFHAEQVLSDVCSFLKGYAEQAESTPAAVLLLGEKGSGRRFLLEQAAARMHGALLAIRPELTEPEDISELVLTALLYNAFPLVEGYSEKQSWLLQAMKQQVPVILLTAETAQSVPDRLLMQRRVDGLTVTERHSIMESLFPMLSESREGRRAAELHRLEPGQLWKAASRFKAESLCTAPEDQLKMLTDILREEDRPAFSGEAQLLSTNKRLDDIVLPPEQRRTLDTICAFARGSTQVYKDWGFEEKIPYGRGVSALFYGASGTGKTLAATALANELELPLYRVDISQLTSKYIGETQKNIGRIFDEAQKSGCILFFDEADALFSRRSEVSDAQDKYSNGEIAYLLQKTEQYEGITILATNLLQNFDEAFRRRITFMVRFPLPDVQLRERLWESIFPEKAPLEDVDFGLLAEQFELSGAGIRNCAVNAAFLAMKQERPIGMSQIMAAIKNEYDKIGKTINPQLLHMFMEEGEQL